MRREQRLSPQSARSVTSMEDPTPHDDIASPIRSLRDRLGGNAEERLGRALSELLESPLFTGAIGRAFDAREKAAQAQEVALGALNLPSAADIERLTRRIRSLSQRLEGIEDGVERLDSSRMAERRGPAELEIRLERVEQQLDGLLGKLDLLLDRIQQAEQSPASSGTAAAPLAAAGAGPKAPDAERAAASSKPGGGAAKAPGAKRKAASSKPGGGAAKAPGAKRKAAAARPKAAGAQRKIRAAQPKSGGARKR